MPLRTQPQPYSIIGNIADLPNPASVPQGYLFHAIDTGECRILVINPTTGVRSWDEFCGATGITGVQGPALIAWAGGETSVNINPIFFIANDPGHTNVLAGGVTPSYPLARARTAMNFAINVREMGKTFDLTVDLLVNGVVVLTHFFSGVVGPTTANEAGPASIPAGAKIDVRVTATGSLFSGSALVSATLEVF